RHGRRPASCSSCHVGGPDMAPPPPPPPGRPPGPPAPPPPPPPPPENGRARDTRGHPPGPPPHRRPPAPPPPPPRRHPLEAPPSTTRPSTSLEYSLAIDASTRASSPRSAFHAPSQISQRHARSSTSASASIHWIAWRWLSFWPNVSRCLACSMAMRCAATATP